MHQLAPSPYAFRTLAIDPSNKGFGFAVLEGTERLLDWGVAQVWSQNDQEFLTRLEGLVDKYRPQLLVVEHPMDSRRGPRAQRWLREARAYAESRSIRTAHVSRVQVRREFESSGVTKFEIAVALSRLFPELAERLPQKRTLWTSEDERMNIFDAVSFGLTALIKAARNERFA